ncbi:MAG TPA: hypothetical protein VM186_05445 [Planctomycetota bacterium]|nr:hypothetical protein [Planctomycetota bacterium]
MAGSATQRTALFARQQPGGFWNTADIKDQPNNIWFVGSAETRAADAVGNGRNPDRPFATLDYAVSHALVATGDTIYLLPGHAENLAADSTVDVDVSNLQILGLGWGGNRPTFTATAIAGDFKLAASCGILRNILFLSGVDATTGLLEVSSTDWLIDNCEFRDSVDEATDMVMVLDGSDRLHIKDCIFTMAAGAGANSAIAIGSSDDVHIEGCRIYGNFAVGAIDFRTAASARANVHDCKIWTENAADIAIIDSITTSTGFIGPNLYIMLQDDAANITEACTGATFHYMRPIHIVNLAGESSLDTNITASTD